MFTEKAQLVIDLAKDFAFSNGSTKLTLSAVLMSMINHQEAAVLLSESIDLTQEQLKKAVPDIPEIMACQKKLPLTENVKLMLTVAKKISAEVPDSTHPGLIDIRHLVCAMAISRRVCSILNTTPINMKDAESILASWYERDLQVPGIEELTGRIRKMRTELLEKVFGQDHAVHAFVEGIFNAEVVAAADTNRKAPRAIFVFAGPPGVGKTYLAELGAAILNRPIKLFDMSAYSGHQQNEALVGMARSFQGAHPGALTEFIEKNPNAVLIFDEIERAHLTTIHLFLQILDAGVLEDKYYERNVLFKDTTIIFTTNAGRQLYDKPNSSGVHSANAAFHRKTILDALKTEKNPQTGQPFFPSAICSRMATGYPILFNHLGVNELEKVVKAELERMSELFGRQYYKKVTFQGLIPICIVLREGVRVDARTVRSQAETFVKTEIFKFCQLFKTERLEEVFRKVDSIHFNLDNKADLMETEVKSLFTQEDLPRVLLVADTDLADMYCNSVSVVDWKTAPNAEDALQILANEDIDMVLMDLWVGRSVDTSTMTIQQFDHIPLAAKGLDQGQELLRKIRERLPDIPVYLLSFAESNDEDKFQRSIDEELFMACVRGGGARGMIVSHFLDGKADGWKKKRDLFAKSLFDICVKLHREKTASRLGKEHKVLTFDTAPQVKKSSKDVIIRLRNFRLTRAIASADTGEVLDDIERPRTRFDDVIGADAAKEELKFFIDYLKNPRRFTALGLKPPKGVLLHGPPGTGKTMLARATAGESDVAFISASASSFVTIWQGSGPQNVRDLFERARRYAPAIIFIDEIDAIGMVRTGGAGGVQATENTLNALLSEMDGFTSPSPDRPVFILAATNFNVDTGNEDSPARSSRVLDPALVRRFSRTILVDLPEKAARLEYLHIRLSNRPACSVSKKILELIAERSAGMSIANLESIIETAARAAVKKNKGLNDQYLEEAFEAIRYGEARSRAPEVVKKTAVHEAGHTIMYWLSGWWPSYVTVVSRGSHGGYMAPCSAQMESGIFSKDELLARIRVSFGGRAAETLVYTDGSGLSTGAAGDLEHATNIAQQMVCKYGMDDEFGLLATPELMKYESSLSSPLYLRVNEAVNKILKEQMALTEQSLEKHRKHLDALSNVLIEKERLTTADLQKILPSIPND